MTSIRSFLLATLTLVAFLIPASAQQMSLSGTLQDVNNGTSYAVTISPVVSPAPEPVTEPVPAPEPVTEPVASSTIPLTYTALQFSGNAVASSTTVASGGTIANKTITDTGQTASIVTRGSATIKNVRIKSREGVRVGGSGTVTIDGSYIETTGSGDDHADGIQAYSPGDRGTLKITNSSIVSHNTAATAGLFIADNWTGTIDLDNVVVQGGPFGVRIHPDVGGDNTIRFKNVCFVGPFGYNKMLFSNQGGHVNKIELWDNVRDCTISSGKLVPGNLIPRP